MVLPLWPRECSFEFFGFVFRKLGPVQTGGGGMAVGVPACPQYGTRIRDSVPLSDSSYLEWEVSGGDGV
jgi:hypothetical protein